MTSVQEALRVAQNLQMAEGVGKSEEVEKPEVKVVAAELGVGTHQEEEEYLA